MVETMERLIALEGAVNRFSWPLSTVDDAIEARIPVVDETS